jgi:hypothetical protein
MTSSEAIRAGYKMIQLAALARDWDLDRERNAVSHYAAQVRRHDDVSPTLASLLARNAIEEG